MMNLSILFVGDDCAEIHIFHTLENIALHERIHFLKFTDQLLDLHSFGSRCPIRTAGTAGIRESQAH